jgi:hypothetical protein
VQPTVPKPLESSLPDLNKLESSLAGMFKKPTNTPSGTNTATAGSTG